MSHIIKLPISQYCPSKEAREQDIELATEEYDLTHTAAFTGSAGGGKLERFRAARERLHEAQRLYWESNFRVLGQKVGAIWK